jgi:phosphoribosylformylglycinamidine synthase
MSMKTVWREQDEQRAVTAPLSLIVSAFAPVSDVRGTLTPQLRTDLGDTDLILIDLGKGQNRLGGSALAQVYHQLGHHGPDLNDPKAFKRFFEVIQELREEEQLLAYHDRSDGGLFVSVCEMAFAGRCGVTIELDELGQQDLPLMFSEELGVVIQVLHTETDDVLKQLHDAGLGRHSHVIGYLNSDDRIEFLATVKPCSKAAGSSFSRPGPRPPAPCRPCVTIRCAPKRSSPVSPRRIRGCSRS